MSEARPLVVPDSAARKSIEMDLKTVLGQLFGISPTEIPYNISLVELGADSLFLLQASQAIRDKFGIKLPFRMMLEEYSTVEAIAGYIERNVSPDEIRVDAADDTQNSAIVTESALSDYERSLETETSSAFALHDAPVHLQSTKHTLTIEPPPVQMPEAPSPPSANEQPISNMERIFAQQLQIMSQQLEVLGRRQGSRTDVSSQSGSVAARTTIVPSATTTTCASPSIDGAASSRPTVPSSFRASHEKGKPAPAFAPGVGSALRPKEATKPYVAYVPIRDGLAGGLTPPQHQHLDDLIARLTQRTQRSKNLAQDYRPVLADNRATAGFRLLWKEMQYPLFVERGKGSRLWDVDGNEYIDLAMGFGALLFGHSPSFVIEALDEQIKRGIQLGGSSPLAAKAAKVICELTGAERVSFCNSGTEAVMSALRLARTVTGRTKIAVFEGAYHGTFDGVMVRGERVDGGKLRAIPLAPGVPQHMIDNVILLDPDDPSCSDVLHANGRDLAAVLLEPLQNRRPDMQPGTFLKQIRQTTKEIGAALIFDEVVSGFRFHPGGAQAVFGVQADLVTYGKAVGAGMPIGVVAGKANFMDAIDGGMWSYGDDSYPRAETTFFAGTYFKHPLIMAAVWASLKHMKEIGPRLQERLNEQTKELVDSLNTYFNKAGVPMRVAHFASLFRFMFPRELNFTDIFYYHMLEQGVYICETRNCLYSTAHTAEDAELILAAVQRSVAQMREGGFLGESRPSPPNDKYLREQPTKVTPVADGSGAAALLTKIPSDGGRVIPLTEAQQGIWSMAHLGGEASCAYNQFFSLRLRGTFDLEAMRGAIADLIDRHEALRIRVKPGGEYQQVQPSLKIEVPLLDLSAVPPERQDGHVSELLRAEGQHAFDLIEGPLVRASVVRLDEHVHVLCLTIHHIVTDGWSNGILLNDLTALYSARCLGVATQLPAPSQYSEFVALEASPHEGSDEDEVYWLDRFADRVPILELPTQSRPPQKTFNAARERLAVSESLYEGLKRISAQQQCTLFMTLIAGFSVMLHKLSEQDDIVVGMTAAGQLAAGGKNIVGYCLNVLPIRSRLIGDPTFAAYLMEMKQTVLDACKHQRYPFRRLLRKLNPARDPSRMPLISVAFNLDKARAASGVAISADAAPQARVGNLEVEFLPNSLVFLQWELFFNMTESERGLLLECDYNTDLFKAHTVRRWMQAYLGLLDAAVAAPLSSVGALGRTLVESNNRWRVIEEKALEEARVKKFDKLRQGSA